jgi:hypothetical protein
MHSSGQPKATTIFTFSNQPQDSKEAKWKRLVKTNYIDPNGVKRDWESAERQV